MIEITLIPIKKPGPDLADSSRRRQRSGVTRVAMSDEQFSKRDERRTFWFLALFAAPILAVLVVGGYGFAVWIAQILTGPPGT